MRAAIALVLISALVSTRSDAQAVADACPSGVVHWSVAGHTVEGELKQPVTAGEPLTVRQRGFSTARAIDWNTPELECRISGGHRGTGALLGAGMGALFGGFMGLLSGDDPPQNWFRFSAGEKAAVLAVVVAPVGAIVGALAGSGAEWAPLAIMNPARRVSAVVDSRGVGIRVAF